MRRPENNHAGIARLRLGRWHDTSVVTSDTEREFKFPAGLIAAAFCDLGRRISLLECRCHVVQHNLIAIR